MKKRLSKTFLISFFVTLLLCLAIGSYLGWRYFPQKDILAIPQQSTDLNIQMAQNQLEKLLNNPQDILDDSVNIEKLPKITLIKVYKSKRYMDVLSGDTIVRRYAIRLGFAPTGHKTEEGDGKTPEGKYQLDWRNPNSLFYKSFHVSYPNKTDKAQAEKRDVSPGSDIMIHGSSNKLKNMGEALYHYIPNRDWTWGCIAVSNAAIDELWLLLDEKTPTPIEIMP